ncbi:hypothetical protein MAHJHV55_52170 [Mycobacterium avium subsp. hominissuis]
MRCEVAVTLPRAAAAALELMDRHVDIADLLEQLAIPIPTVTTPQMFIHQLTLPAARRMRSSSPSGSTMCLRSARACRVS